MDIFSIAKLQVSKSTVVENQVITFDKAMDDKVFEHVKFTNVKFIKCEFYKVWFIDCIFQNVNFVNCKFINCNFNTCTMSNIKVVSTQLYANFNFSHISQITCRHINCDIYVMLSDVKTCELLSSNVSIHVLRSTITFARSYNNHISYFVRASTIHRVLACSTYYSNLDLEHAEATTITYKKCNLSILIDYSFFKHVKFNKCNIQTLYAANTNFSNILCNDTKIAKRDLEQSTIDEHTCESLCTKYSTGAIVQEAIIGYKKVSSAEHSSIILKLEIPKGAIVFSINGSKCRTNTAKVLEIVTKDIPKNTVMFSTYNNYFTYEVGKTYEIPDFDTRYNIECSSGIHFFKTVEEAAAY